MGPISRDSFQPERLQLFWEFVTERQNIWKRRFLDRQPPPWTEDEVLAGNRFTNIYRELDPGTQYAINSILETPNTLSDKVFNLMIYRLIGRSETHAYLGFQRVANFSPKVMEERLKRLRDVENQPVFTAAYMVSGYTGMGTRDKVTNVSRIFAVIHSRFPGIMAAIQSAEHPRDIYAALRSAQGLGNFLAYQVLVDLLYPVVSNGGKPLLPFTHNDWAAAGPGAQAGIAMLLRPGLRADQLSVMTWLTENQEAEFKRLKIQFPYLVGKDGKRKTLSLANIQNSLCEFHKFVKISDGTGRARRRYSAKPDLQRPLTAFAGV